MPPSKEEEKFEGKSFQRKGIFGGSVVLFVENFTDFLKLGTLFPYQAADRLRPWLAKAYRLALAKSAYSRFSFFARPL